MLAAVTVSGKVRSLVTCQGQGRAHGVDSAAGLSPARLCGRGVILRRAFRGLQNGDVSGAWLLL